MPEIEAAAALLEVWDGEVEELAWAAELFHAIAKKSDPADARVKELSALAARVCLRARETGDAIEIALLEKAIARHA
jgi:hypothetical protein